VRRDEECAARALGEPSSSGWVRKDSLLSILVPRFRESISSRFGPEAIYSCNRTPEGFKQYNINLLSFFLL